MSAAAAPATQPARPRRPKAPKAQLGSGVVWAGADVVMAPVPQFVADFLHHMQGELIKAADHAPAPGSVLLAPERARSWEHTATGHSYGRSSREDCYFQAFQFHTVSGWSCEANHRVYERRLDQAGKQWERNYMAVADDFGNLVEVAPQFEWSGA